MILCYIWIQDFKGFSNQGFNFSTEYSFDFEVSELKLTRKINEKFIQNFFSDDITEITGIIGKNASGKTNILELIQYIAEGANTIVNKPFLTVFKDDNKYKIYTFKLQQIICDFDAEKILYEGRIPNINSIYFSNVFDGRRHNFSKKIINLSTNDLLNSQFGENVNKNYQNIIQQQIRFIKSKQFKFLEDIEFSVNKKRRHQLKPSKVILTSPIWSNIITRVKSFEKKLKDASFKNVQLGEFVRSFRRKITENKTINSIKYYTAFLVFLDFILNRDILNYKESKLYNNEKEYFSIVNELLTTKQNDLRIDEIYIYFTTEFAQTIDKYWNVFETSKFLTDLREFDLGINNSSYFKEDVGTYASRRIQFTVEYNEKVGSFLNCYLDAVTNQNLAYSVEWAGMSSGYKAYLNIFANFYSILGKIKEKNVLICIDEGDLYFHPKWQTEYLYKLINILPMMIGKPCQLILTTHSPFLVSDLPKNNLIFVEKSNNGNLIVIPKEKIEGETFGGNIGELYLDAFFMQGSLISHFAASKIKVLIRKVKKKQIQISSEERILLGAIGEELIKSQIKKLIDANN